MLQLSFRLIPCIMALHTVLLREPEPNIH